MAGGSITNVPQARQQRSPTRVMGNGNPYTIKRWDYLCSLIINRIIYNSLFIIQQHARLQIKTWSAVLRSPILFFRSASYFLWEASRPLLQWFRDWTPARHICSVSMHWKGNLSEDICRCSWKLHYRDVHKSRARFNRFVWPAVETWNLFLGHWRHLQFPVLPESVRVWNLQAEQHSQQPGVNYASHHEIHAHSSLWNHFW